MTPTEDPAPLRRALPRVPLPVKLLLSYLLVIAIAAVPAMIYLRAHRQTELVANRTLGVVRNAQAVAVSLAIGLSLLAAVVFVRPLQRVTRLAAALAAGDYGAHLSRLADDEVGDVGRALEHLGLSLRRRLASAGLGEALLEQLVDALAQPCVVVEAQGDVVAVNGAARRLLQANGPDRHRLLTLFLTPAASAALATAESEGEPEPVTLELEGLSVTGHMHVLKRPSAAPLHVFLGAAAPPSSSSLPMPGAVHPRALVDLLRSAASVAPDITIEMGGLPSVLVAEAEERLLSAVSLLLQASAALGKVAVDRVGLEPTRVRLRVTPAPASAVLEPARRALEPLGGAVELGESQDLVLWLPRA